MGLLQSTRALRQELEAMRTELALNGLDDILSHGDPAYLAAQTWRDTFVDQDGVDTGAAIGATYDGASYTNSAGVTLISAGVGAIIKSGTAYGTAADLFNGATAQATTADNSWSGAEGWAGKDWGAARAVAGYKVYPTTDYGFSGFDATVTIYLDGSHDGAAWTQIHTTGAIADTAVVNVASGLPATAYRCHRVRIVGATGDIRAAEIQFCEALGAVAMTLPSIAIAFDDVAAQARVVALWEPLTTVTNYARYSQQADNAVYAQSIATVTADAIAAPDGTVTADKVVEAAVVGEHMHYQILAIAAGQTVVSHYLKAGERTRAEIGLWNATDGYVARVRVDLLTGAIVQLLAGSVEIEDAGGGWWRVAVTGVTTAPNSRVFVYTMAGTVSYAGDGVSGLYVWGLQVELAATAGRYVATTASAATVAAVDLNSDFAMSVLDDATWRAVPLEDLGAYRGTPTRIIAGTVALTGGGASVKWRATAVAGKESKLHAIWMQGRAG